MPIEQFFHSFPLFHIHVIRGVIQTQKVLFHEIDGTTFSLLERIIILALLQS